VGESFCPVLFRLFEVGILRLVHVQRGCRMNRMASWGVSTPMAFSNDAPVGFECHCQVKRLRLCLCLFSIESAAHDDDEGDFCGTPASLRRLRRRDFSLSSMRARKPTVVEKIFCLINR